jgi:diguanylate cyclase (GGDEF)-like protein
MSRTKWVSLGRHWSIGVAGLMTVAHPVLPVGVRSVTYLLVSALTVPPLVSLLRRVPSRDRLPWWILLGAMSVLTAGNTLAMYGGRGQRMNSESLVTVANAALLAAAVALVLRRGRNDIGGVLDVSVGAVGVGGLLWTVLLFPRLEAMHSGTGEELALLVSVLVLLGVLGALMRVWRVSDRRLPALVLLVWALLLALIGNIVLALTTGSMTTGRLGWIEMFFLLAYLCVGAAPLQDSVYELMKPGPAPADRLSVGRLAFLGAALAIISVAGGVREIAGLKADGPLLAVGTLLMVPLVMIRVGRLAAERRRAETALHRQATHDQLTGLPNRAELLARLGAALVRERSSGRASVVLLFGDLNGFKAVNDRLGHLVGDRLLAEVGARIGAVLRSGETLARYGGDEFLVLCETEDQEQAALRLTAHVERAFEEPFVLAGERIRIGISIGAVVSDGDLGADELIRRADQAMYAVKQRVPVTAR